MRSFRWFYDRRTGAWEEYEDDRPRVDKPTVCTGSTRDWVDIWEIRRQFLAFRRERGWTQKRMSEIIGIDISTIFHIENGRHLAHPSTWHKFLRLKKRHDQARRELPVHWD
jgi:DNA-binding XRE family transcriptional regulator